MLLNLHIKNMALIDEMDINFAENLNVLTGETGAGKSIIIDSILLALGGKTPKDFVRKDAEYGLVELLFSVEEEEIRKRLLELEIPDVSSGELILSRKIVGTRNISKVNGETVTLSKLREIAALLLDLHAQHEHQSLLVPGNHLKLLDRYGQESLAPLKENVKALYQEYAFIKEALMANTMDEDEKKRRLDLLEYERKEIADARLQPGEDEALESEYQKAAAGKRIAESLQKASQSLENGATEGIDRAVRELADIVEYDLAISSMAEALITVSDLLTDFNRDARDYLENQTYSEEEFVQLEKRLNLLNHLKAKYGRTIDEVLAYGANVEKEQDKLLHQEQYLQKLQEDLAKKEEALLEACRLLETERKQIAKKVTKDITKALQDLNFLDVRFDMVFESLDHFTSEGTDYAYFIISTNVGEDMKPLWQVASGGELSRIMLAMKSCLANADRIETLIFDEIDVGISGRTAQMVAEKIHKIGENHQVICITHLPQIAAMSNHHYRIEKQVNSGKTITSIHSLSDEESVAELARLIGGVEITDTVLQSAKEMKELAGKAKVN